MITQRRIFHAKPGKAVGVVIPLINGATVDLWNREV